MNEQHVDYAESILQANNILIKKQLETLAFDRTIEATVIGAKDADKGIYTISIGNVSFTAYSSETGYKEKDVVMVTIPEGNYNNQKIITGKKVKEDEETPLVYKSPFSQIVDLTGNLITNSSSLAIGIIANKDTDNETNGIEDNKWDIGISDFLDSSIKQSIFTTSISDPSSFTRVGIRINVATQLPNVVAGNYGIAAVLYFYNPELESNSDDLITRTVILDSDNFFGNVYNFNSYTVQEGIFDISDLKDYRIKSLKLFAYQRKNFKDNNNQNFPVEETTLPNIFIKDIYVCLGTDISEFTGDYVKLYIANEVLPYYQRNMTSALKILLALVNQNSTINIPKDYIPYKLSQILEEFQGYTHSSSINENNKRIVDTLKENLQDTTAYTQDNNLSSSGKNQCFNQIQKIMTNLSGIYDAHINENRYTINLNWIHKKDNNEISKVKTNNWPTEYYSYWYIYQAGAPSPDRFAGAEWVRFYGASTDPDKNGNYYQDSDQNNKKIQQTFCPNINRAKEQFKVIIIKENVAALGSNTSSYQKIAESNIITFINKDEIPKDNFYQLDDLNYLTPTDLENWWSDLPEIDTNALSIRFDDNERGNYFLYNRAGSIKAEKDKELRTLTAVFDTFKSNIYAKSILTKPYDLIQWSFPASNSMIQPVIYNKNMSTPIVCSKPDNISTSATLHMIYETTNSKMKVVYNSEADTFDFIAEDVDDGFDFVTVNYYIKKTLNRSAGRNNVFLTVEKGEQTYTAQAQMHFGPAGTSGSDYTITIEWNNNENAFDVGKVDKDSAYKIGGQVYLYNQEGKLVNPEKDYTYNLVSSEPMNINNDWRIEETENLLYPIILRKENSSTTTIGAFDSMLYCDNTDNNDTTSIPSFYDQATGTNELRYWISCKWSRLSGHNLFIYDFQKKTFKKVPHSTDPDPNVVYYTQIPPGNTSGFVLPSKYKIKFEAFDEVITQPFKDARPDITTNNTYNGIVSRENGKTVFYYNQGTLDNRRRRAFIKINNTYIVDPAIEYNPDFTYYYPVFETVASYKNEDNLGLKLTSTGINNDTFSIQKNNNNNLSMDSLYLLEISLQNFIGQGKNITATFPLALKQTLYDGSIQSFIEDGIDGPTEIRYSTSGVIDFDRNPYQLYIRERKQNGTYSSSLLHETDYAYTWILKYPNKVTKSSEKGFYPKLVETKQSSENASFMKRPFLEPFGVYHQFSNVIGVQVQTRQPIVNNNSSEIILWTQPIYIYQDNYPSTTLNRWGGENIVQEDDTGIILAKGFGAGKKEDDNSFTGVVLGDWSKTDSDIALTKTTGVFGLNHGAMAYALMDDGTAFFGKEGSGRIYFDGNTAQIYSANWKDLVTEEENNEIIKLHNKKQGMMIDLDDGILDIENTMTNFNPNWNPIASESELENWTISSDEQDQYSTKTFSFLADSQQPLLSLSVEYQAPTVYYQAIDYQNENSSVTKVETQTVLIQTGLQHLRLCSNSPFLSIGADKQLEATSAYEFASGVLCKYNHDFIRINSHGGFLASANFTPTISGLFTKKPKIRIDSTHPKAKNVYSLRDKNDLVMIYPDNMTNRKYHAWGDNKKSPFIGLVIDLTHGDIVLGNDAEIKGYQTGVWGPSTVTVTGNQVPERVFHISNGANNTPVTDDGRILSIPNSSIGGGYFILAETIKKTIPDDESQIYESLPSATDYHTKFRVNWDGSVQCSGEIDCDSVYSHRSIYAGSGINCGGDLHVSGTIYPSGGNPSSLRFKENIASIPDSNLLYQLQPVKFKYKTSSDYNYGFIAEDVYKVLPEIVRKDINNSNELSGLDYNSIFTLAVAEIQKLHKELNIIKQKIEIKEERHNDYNIN